MFKPTNARNVKEYIDQIDEPRKYQIKELYDFISKLVPDLDVFIVHNIIGFGKYHYKTKSGQEGDWFTLGLASQKNYISVYSCMVEDGQYLAEKYADVLGKVNVGKSCIRFKKLEDIDMTVLEKVVLESAEIFRREYL